MPTCLLVVLSVVLGLSSPFWLAAIWAGLCWLQAKTRRIRWSNCFTWTDEDERAVGRRALKGFSILGRRVIGFLGPSGCYVQPSLDKIVTVVEPDGLVIDERCPACAGSGRLRVDLLAADVDEERVWRELEAEAKEIERKKCMSTPPVVRRPSSLRPDSPILTTLFAEAALAEAKRRQDDAVAALKDYTPGDSMLLR